MVGAGLAVLERQRGFRRRSLYEVRHEVPGTEEEIDTLGDEMLTLRERINIVVGVCDDIVADHDQVLKDCHLRDGLRGWYRGGSGMAKQVSRWLTKALEETKEI